MDHFSFQMARFQWMREAGGGVRRCTPNIEGERDSPDRGLG
jgi:hypothetical protein